MKILSDISVPVHMYVENELFTHVTPDTFGDMIYRFMGEEAANFYRELIADTNEACTECDEVYRTQEHYQRVISEALEILDDVEVKKASEIKFKEAYDKLYSEAGCEPMGRYEPDIQRRYPMNREEYIAVRRLFGAFSTYIQYYEQMKKRAQKGPRWLWRDLRMLAVVWQRVLHGLCQTMPEDKLKTLHSELDHIQIEVYVKNPVTGGKRHDGNLYVPEDAMCRLIDKAMSMECFGCTKCGADVKKCPLRKDINALYPYEIPVVRTGTVRWRTWNCRL